MATPTLPLIPELPRIDHTQLEYDTVRKMLQDYMIDNFSDNWNDFLESNSGQMMLELFSYFAHNMAFRVDTVVNESFIPTVQNREHALRLLRLVDYQMMAIQQSSVLLEATRMDTDYSIQNDIVLYNPDINISTTLTAKNKNNQSTVFTILANQFDYDTPVIISKVKDYIDGALTEINPPSSNVFAYNGTIRSELIDTVTGEDNQTYILSLSPVIWDSIKVLIDIGNGWQKLANNQYLVSEKLKQDGNTALPVYRIEWDSDSKVKIVFGSERYGNKPLIGHRLKFQYMVGGGSSGNIGRIGIDQTLLCNNILSGEVVGQSQVNFINNKFEAAGGKDEETIEEAKIFAPLLLRTAWKANTREDYNVLISDLSSIRLARVATDEENDLVSRYNTKIYIVPNEMESNFDNYYALNPTLQQFVKNFLDGNNKEPSHKVVGIDNVILPARIMEFGIDIEVTKNLYYDNQAIENEIITILKNYFDPQIDDENLTDNPRFDFGRTINKQTIEFSIHSLKSIKSVDNIKINIQSPIKQYNASYNNYGNLVYHDIMLPPYPNHEEIYISTKEHSSNASLELLYSVPDLKPEDTTYNEYIDGKEINIDNVHIRCYDKLSNQKQAIDYTGNYSDKKNSWLRFSYAEEDINTFRQKTYHGKDASIENGNIILAQNAELTNSIKKTVILCNRKVYDIYGTTAKKYLSIKANNKIINIKFPNDIVDTPQGVADYINNYIMNALDLNYDLLRAFIKESQSISKTKYTQLILQSNFDIEVLDSSNYNSDHISINGTIGLLTGIYNSSLIVNHLPCSPKTIINDGENEIMFRINGKRHKVILPTSKPTVMFTNQINKYNNGLGTQVINRKNNKIFISTFPGKYILEDVGYVQRDDGKWTIENNIRFLENQTMVLDDENASMAPKTISNIYIRLSSDVDNTILTDDNDGWAKVKDSRYAKDIIESNDVICNTKEDLVILLDDILDRKNTFIYDISFEKIKPNLNYLLEAKAYKKYETINRIIPTAESDIATQLIRYNVSSSTTDVNTNFNDIILNNISTSFISDGITYEKNIYENRMLWIDDNIRTNKKLTIDFSIIPVIDLLNINNNITPRVKIKGTDIVFNEDEIHNPIVVTEINEGMVDYSSVDGGYVVECKENMTWELDYINHDDYISTEAKGSIKIDMLTDCLALVSNVIKAINEQLGEYFYATFDSTGKQITVILLKKQIITKESEFFNLLFEKSVTIKNQYVYSFLDDDRFDNIKNERLDKSNKYDVIIEYGFKSLSDSRATIPLYYYKSFDYSGALNREKLKQIITEQVPNNQSELNLIVADENEIPLLNYNNIKIKIK